ncbi:MAG: hypothetical protein EOO43_22250 [Flavobacterium sp.]|nr:MAG: hypothetical protein EOO43_22250 [Flavobacterium sp.]
MEHLLKQREKLIKKLVSNAKAILSNQISLPLGIARMGTTITWIENIERLPNINLQILLEYNNLTAKYFIGTERLMCNKDFLIEQDKELDKITMMNKDKLISKCYEILELFEAKEK